MKHFIIKVIILLIIVLGGFSISPLYSQQYKLINGDSTVTVTNLNGEYKYTYLYVANTNVHDSLAYTDSLLTYTYNPMTRAWNRCIMLDINTNTNIAVDSCLALTDGSSKIYKLLEEFIYGIKIIRTNQASSNDYYLNILIKNKNDY